MDEIKHDHLRDFGLQLDREVKKHFFEAGKWGKFIGVVVFIVSGILLVVGIIGGNELAKVANKLLKKEMFDVDLFGIFVVLLLFVVAIAVVTYYFLFNFGIKMKAGLLSNDTEKVNMGFRSLKIFFMITTVLAIASLLLSIYNMFTSNP